MSIRTSPASTGGQQAPRTPIFGAMPARCSAVMWTRWSGGSHIFGPLIIDPSTGHYCGAWRNAGTSQARLAHWTGGWNEVTILSNVSANAWYMVGWSFNREQSVRHGFAYTPDNNGSAFITSTTSLSWPFNNVCFATNHEIPVGHIATADTAHLAFWDCFFGEQDFRLLASGINPGRYLPQHLLAYWSFQGETRAQAGRFRLPMVPAQGDLTFVDDPPFVEPFSARRLFALGSVLAGPPPPVSGRVRVAWFARA